MACKQETDLAPGGYGKNNFYTELTTTDDWVKYEFFNQFGEKFVSGGVMMVCDSANPIVYSFDGGKTIHGELRLNEAQSFDGMYRECVHLKSLTPGNAGVVRLYVW